MKVEVIWDELEQPDFFTKMKKKFTKRREKHRKTFDNLTFDELHDHVFLEITELIKALMNDRDSVYGSLYVKIKKR